MLWMSKGDTHEYPIKSPHKQVSLGLPTYEDLFCDLVEKLEDDNLTPPQVFVLAKGFRGREGLTEGVELVLKVLGYEYLLEDYECELYEHELYELRQILMNWINLYVPKQDTLKKEQVRKEPKPLEEKIDQLVEGILTGEANKGIFA